MTRRDGYWRMTGTNDCTYGSIITVANNKKGERVLDKTLHMMHLHAKRMRVQDTTTCYMLFYMRDLILMTVIDSR